MKNVGYPLLAALAAMAGCTQYLPSVGPDYSEPKYDFGSYALPDAGSPTTNLTETCEYAVADTNDDVRVVLSNDTMAKWWLRFDDPVLVQLVDRAVSSNLNYRIVQERLTQAYWELRGTYAAFLPKLGVDGGWTHTVNRANNPSLDGSNLASKRVSSPKLGLGLNWEIDLFGGSRRQTESAIALFEAAGWTVSDAWVALTTQVGAQYINLRTTQARLEVSRGNLKLQSETYDILRSRLESGIGDELAVKQSAYMLEQTRARIPQLKAQEEQLKNALATLLGEMPGSLHDLLEPVKDGRDWLLAPQKVEELPMNLIRARPDVRGLERRLAAQVARIGVAKAQWFPKLYINGSIGYNSTSWRNLFMYDSIYSSFGPSVSWPIFQAGAIYSSVKAEESKTQQALLAYEQGIKQAYGEVRTAYSAYSQEYLRYQSLRGAVKAASDAVTISKDLYKNGLKDFNNVLDAQRSLLTYEEDAVMSRGQITLDLIELYRSLGGGLATPEDASGTKTDA